MGIISQNSRLSHHTITSASTTFTVPSSEDFTDGSWDPLDLALSEIGVNETDGTAYIRIGSTIHEIILDTAGTGATFVTKVQPGVNITTGGTYLEPVINVVASPGFNNISWSGTGTGNAFSATTVSASTFYSGSTNLANIFQFAGGDFCSTGLKTDAISACTGTVDVIGDMDLASGTLSGNLRTFSISGSSNPGSNFYISNYGSGIVLDSDQLVGFGLRDSNNQLNVGMVIRNVGVTFVTNSPVNSIALLNAEGVMVSGTASGTTVIGGIAFTADTPHTTYIGGDLRIAEGTGSTVVYSGGTKLDEILALKNLNGSPCDFSFALSDETTQITTGETKLTFYAPYPLTINEVKVSLSQSGSAISTFDVNVAGTTIFSTRPTIDANEFHTKDATTPAVITGGTVAEDAKITFDVDTIGTGCAGAKVYLLGTRSL